MKPSIRRHLSASVVMLFALACAASASAAGLTKVFYPSQADTAFTVEVPSDWKMIPQGEEGAEDYFEVEGPSGLELSFRTVPDADMEGAVEAHMAYLKENFTDVSLGEPKETTINGMEAILLPGTGTDEDGSVRDLGAGWFKISDDVVGELWYNADKSDGATQSAAAAVLNSLKGV